MNQKNNNKDNLEISLSQDELLDIHSSFNEVCNGFHISDSDLEKQICSSKSSILELFNKISPLAFSIIKK